MATESLAIKSINSSSKSTTRTLGYVNPDATNTQLGKTAQLFNALSTRTYDNAYSIRKTDVTEPQDQVSPNLTADYNSSNRQLTVNSNSTSPIRVLYSQSQFSPATYTEISGSSPYSIPQDTVVIIVVQSDSTEYLSAGIVISIT